MIEAPARCFSDQNEVLEAFKAGELDRDVAVVVRFQGPRANGMPELHKLTPTLGVLQDRGHQRRAGHRRAHVGRQRQGAGRDPRLARGACPTGRWRGCATATSIRLDARNGHARSGRRRPGVAPARQLAAAARRDRPRAVRADAAARQRGRSRRVGDARGDGGRASRDHRRDHARRAGDPGAGPRRERSTRPLWPRRLVEAGLPVLEVTLRTPRALEAIRAMAAVPGAIVGAGTVLNRDQLGPGDRGGRAIHRLARPDRRPWPSGRSNRDVAYLPGVATAERHHARARPWARPVQILPRRSRRRDGGAEGPVARRSPTFASARPAGLPRSRRPAGSTTRRSCASAAAGWFRRARPTLRPSPPAPAPPPRSLINSASPDLGRLRN